MSTPSDPPPPAFPMPLDSIESELIFLAQQCRLAKLAGDDQSAEKFWNFLHPHLQKAFRALVKRYALSTSDQNDLHQEATIAVWKKIDRFDLAEAQNYKRPFTGWALDQGRYAIIEHFRKMGPSRVHSERIEKIIEKLIELFPNGPDAGETWFDLARAQVRKLADALKITETQIHNTLAAWSLRDAEDIDNTDEAFQEDIQRFTMEELEWALAKLAPRSRRFLLQKHVSGLSYAEIVEKYNLENPAQKVTVENARKIVSKAIEDLGDELGGLE
jgi:RNA polymerase sigma factor (sigma-70 family)